MHYYVNIVSKYLYHGSNVPFLGVLSNYVATENKLYWRKNLEEVDLLENKLRRQHEKAIKAMMGGLKKDNKHLGNHTALHLDDETSMSRFDYDEAREASRVKPSMESTQQRRLDELVMNPFMPADIIPVNVNRMQVHKQAQRMRFS